MTETGEITELRELIREAHGAIKDMERLLRDIRQAAREGAEQAAPRAGGRESGDGPV